MKKINNYILFTIMFFLVTIVSSAKTLNSIEKIDLANKIANSVNFQNLFSETAIQILLNDISVIESNESDKEVIKVEQQKSFQNSTFSRNALETEFPDLQTMSESDKIEVYTLATNHPQMMLFKQSKIKCIGNASVLAIGCVGLTFTFWSGLVFLTCTAASFVADLMAVATIPAMIAGLLPAAYGEMVGCASISLLIGGATGTILGNCGTQWSTDVTRCLRGF